jgi:hypothetical protein
MLGPFLMLYRDQGSFPYQCDECHFECFSSPLSHMPPLGAQSSQHQEVVVYQMNKKAYKRNNLMILEEKIKLC